MQAVRVLAMVIGLASLLMAIVLGALSSGQFEISGTACILSGGLLLIYSAVTNLRNTRGRRRLLKGFGGGLALFAIASGLFFLADRAGSPLFVFPVGLAGASALGTALAWRNRRTSGTYLQSYFSD